LGHGAAHGHRWSVWRGAGTRRWSWPPVAPKETPAEKAWTKTAPKRAPNNLKSAAAVAAPGATVEKIGTSSIGIGANANADGTRNTTLFVEETK
jgi:hypothetical protein